MKKGEFMKKNVLMVHNFYQIGGGEHTVFNNEVELLEKHNQALFPIRYPVHC